MLRIFFAMVSSAIQVFLQVFQMHVSSVLSARMLQVLHLNVSKVDRVLHLTHRLLLPRLGVSSSRASWASVASSLTSPRW